MAENKRKPRNAKSSTKQNNKPLITKNSDFTKVVKIMANTPPISNEEIVRRNRESRS